MTYKLCKMCIEKKIYASKEEMTQKLDVFLLNNRLTQDEYSDLTTMLQQA